MSSTPEDETVAAIHYDMVESIIDAAQTMVQMHPDSNKDQVEKMLYLFVNTMQAFIQAVPGLEEENLLLLAKKAYDIARTGDIPCVDTKLN